jgi:N6-adenosine-specific RNA methylase IME4
VTGQLFLGGTDAEPRYRTIELDPPWNELGGGRRGAQMHYPVVQTRNMPSVILGARDADGRRLFSLFDDAHVWMWTTVSHEGAARWLLHRLGVVPTSSAVWIKTDPDDVDEPAPRLGLGQYMRIEHELLLFAVRGQGQCHKVWTGAHDVRSVIRAPRGRHSAKPAAAYELIERVSKGPRLAMFARPGGEPHLRGWDVWGDEFASGLEVGSIAPVAEGAREEPPSYQNLSDPKRIEPL